MPIVTGNKKSILEKKFAKLCWILLEHKCLYYVLNKAKYHHLMISDKDYDTLEAYYVYLCKKMKVKPTINKMVGFDPKKPSCNIVMKKIMKTKQVLKSKKMIQEAKETLE